jgi:general secretion pathway protein D
VEDEVKAVRGGDTGGRARGAGRRRRVLVRLAAVLMMAVVLAGCAASRAFNRGNEAAQLNEWDVAIEQYRQALQREPDNVTYRIALQRALTSASRYWAEQARIAEARGQLDEALLAYRRANQFDPTSSQLSAKISELERRIRGVAEPVAPAAQQQQAVERVQQIGGPPALVRLDERLPRVTFSNANARDVLTSIGNVAGINVTFERDFPTNLPISVELNEVTLEEALNQLMAANQLFYKVLNERTILVIPDTQPKRLQYDDQVVRVIRLAHADASELQGLINTVVRVPGNIQLGTNWQVIANKTQNTLTYRAPASVAAVIERLVAASDKPRAEIIVDVEILEVNRTRIKQYGLDLGNYEIGATLAPEGLSDDPFSLRSVTRGVGQDDLFLTVPSAVVRFLEQDSETKLLARPQLRGAEGQEISLELGEEVPIPTTVFQPLAQGGANFQPLSSFNYRAVGIIVTITPQRVTPDGEVILDLLVENSSRGGDVNISGNNLPTFATRRARATIRLRDGETNLLAGLIQENDRRQLRGIPGILRLPVIRQLFSANDTTIQQTDIIILLTPRVVKTHEVTQQDLDPIVMRTPTTLGLGGSSTIVQPPIEPAPQVAPLPGAPGQPQPPPGPGAQPPPATPPQGAVPPAAPGVAPAPGAGRILLTPNATELRAGTDGLLVPVTADVSRLSRVSVTVTYNPAVLRVRTVQQGSFLAVGGGAVTFTEDHDTPGRIDIVMMRTADQTGAAGVGQLAAILFETIAAGQANLNITGTAADPKGAALPVEFVQAPPVTAR